MTDEEAIWTPSAERIPRGRPKGGIRDTSIQRHHLIRGVVESLAELGYSASTVTHICARAKVSSRTFYEHFDNKESAFLAAYHAADTAVMGTVRRAMADASTWSERLSSGTRTYVAVMLDHPEASLVFLREPWRAGVPAWELRRRILNEWSSLLQKEIARARNEDTVLAGISSNLDEVLALSVIHGIEGLVLHTIEFSGSADDLTAACVSLIAGVSQKSTQAFTRLFDRGGARVSSMPSRDFLRPTRS